MKAITAFDGFLERFSRWGLILSMFLILGFSVFSIVLRWTGQSLMWLDPLVRHMVFLSAFFGGSLATSANVHIKVDLFTKLIEASKSKALHWLQKNIVNLFCLITTAVLTKAAWDFFLVEKEYGAPSFLNIHSSLLVGIIPFGMGLISIRYLNQLLLRLFKGNEQ